LRAPIYTGADSDLQSLIGGKTKSLPKGHPPPGTLKLAIYAARLSSQCTSTDEVWIVGVRSGKGETRGKDKASVDAYYAKWVEYGHMSVARFKGSYTDYPLRGKGRLTGLALRRNAATTFVQARPYMRPAFESKKAEAVTAMQQYLNDRVPILASSFKYLKAA
jgi:hypothetical protein